MNIDRILNSRIFSTKKSVYRVFEKRVLEAFYLEREIRGKFGKREQYQSRIQYLVFLVSCLEYFLEEIFKMAVDKKVIGIQEIKKYRSLKSTKFTLEELEQINKDKIKISEIIAEELNFQNIITIANLCDMLKLEENFPIIKAKNLDLGMVKIGLEPKKTKSKISIKLEKKLVKMILKGFLDVASNVKKDSKELVRILNTIGKMILLRHRIVHKNQIIKIENWEILAYTMATTQLAYLVNQAYNLELDKIRK